MKHHQHGLLLPTFDKSCNSVTNVERISSACRFSRGVIMWSSSSRRRTRT